MEKKAPKNKEEKNHIIRAGLIDGLPTSYITSYVVSTKKCCEKCVKRNKLITQKQINRNEIICDENFNFYHKDCLKSQNITYEHRKPNDKSSAIKLT